MTTQTPLAPSPAPRWRRSTGLHASRRPGAGTTLEEKSRPDPAAALRVLRRAQPLVLLVDDLEDQRDLYRQYLEYAGYRCEVAASGFEAIEKSLEMRPDAVVMDLSMPGLDGFEATQRLKRLKTTRLIPVIALTAHGELPEEWALSAGCSVYLRKPCAPYDLAGTIRAVTDAPPPVSVQPHSAPLILIVEDRRDDRELYSEYLAFHGCRVVTAENGLEALEKAQQTEPQVIVMDLLMPHMDGWEAIRRLKQDALTVRIPIVAMTSETRDGLKWESWRAGCASFLQKPLLPEVLLAEVRRLVEAAPHGH